MQLGTRIPGPHYVMPRAGVKLRQVLGDHEMKGAVWCHSLTQARKTARAGDCIVRAADRCVVAIKGGA